MIHIKLFENFEEPNKLNSFLKTMYGDLRRSYSELPDEQKETLNQLIDKFYKLDKSTQFDFTRRLAKYKTWDEVIEAFQTFCNTNCQI